MDSVTVKKKFLIVFSDVHLAYSPSTLNLFYTLQKQFDVELISAKPDAYFSEKKVIDKSVKYIDFEIKRNSLDIIKRIFYRFTDKITNPSGNTLQQRRLHNYKTKTLISYIKKTEREIIVVDFLALWCAQQAGKRAHLLSLEINQNDPYYPHIQLNRIISVIIQSQERFDHLFPAEKPKCFIVQNAPVSINFTPAYNKRKKTDLLYCGSAVAGFGIITCLDFIKDYKEYTLTVKGALPKDTEQVINEFYADLITEKRLVIDSEYLSDKELTYFISEFRIGFSFYDFYRFEYLRTFNYYTAPSGKVFQYLNSGVPIIGNVLPGFQFIEKTVSGKLISYLSSQQIKMAIDVIEKDYLKYAENSKRISFAYDFNKMIGPFLQFVASNIFDN